MTRKLLLLTLIATMFFACKSGDTERITVASELADCVGAGPMKCLLIKHSGSDSWEFWYFGIEGFDYEPGFEYKLEVRRETVDNPPMGASSIRLVLVRELSRTKKTSEGMPAGITR